MVAPTVVPCAQLLSSETEVGDHWFKASLGYKVRPCLKQTNQQTKSHSCIKNMV
jgi:hypothetical protein